MNIFLLIVLILLILLLIYIVMLSNELKNVSKQLTNIVNHETNKEVVLNSRNYIIVNLVNTINSIIKKQKNSHLNMTMANNQLDTAISNISHDLRTPLTVARGYTQHLLESNIDEENRVFLLTKILENLKSVEEKLEDLLEYNRINENRLTLNLEKVNISRLLQEKALNMYESFVDSDIDLKLSIEPNIVKIVDEKYMDRIFQNILGNILTHGYKSGEIKLYKSDTQVIFESINNIKDTIKNPDKLIERFYTEDLSRQNKNAGLGLYIVNELVSRQSGTLEINTSNDIFHIKIKII